MQSTIIRAAAAIAVLTVVGAAQVEAQVASPIGFNVRAGAAIPSGDAANGINTGLTLGAGLSFRPPMLPVGLRFDGDYNRFGAKDVDAHLNIWSLTANAEIAPAMSPIYFIGGIGMYSSSAGGPDVLDSTTETDIGFNGGAGFRLPMVGFKPFVEARFHSISSEGERSNYIPIVLGLSF